MGLPKNIVVRRILVTDLSQQLKKQRDFLKWMSRRYLPINEEQSAAFATGARLFDELRADLVAGLFDEEVFTNELPAGAEEEPAQLEFDAGVFKQQLTDMLEDPRQRISRENRTRFIPIEDRLD